MNTANYSDKDSAKANKGNLIRLLQQTGADTAKRKIKCPFHRDEVASGEVRQAKSGAWYFYCYVCDIADDCFALQARIEGRDVKEIFKEELSDMQTFTPLRPKGFTANGESFESFDALIETWEKRNPGAVLQEKNRYTNPETNEADYYTLRILPKGSTKKEFRQVSKIDGRWQWKQPDGKLPLFNRIRIAECDTVIIFEGEKCVREFTKLGFEGVAGTTAPQGSNGATKTDWTPLAGKKCFIWRDNDEPGEKYQKQVVEELLKLSPGCQIYTVRVEDLELKPKDDIVDYLSQINGTLEDKQNAVALVIRDSEPQDATNALQERIHQIASGKFKNISFSQFPVTSNLSKALMPGTIITICGEPGAGKSFFLLESFWRWQIEKDIKVKLFMFEDDDAFHQNRALAQMSGYSDLTDVDFCADNAEFYQNVFDQYGSVLEPFARNLEVANSKQKTLDEVADWVKLQAETGAEIIGIDPITAAKVSDKPYIDDQRFLFKVKEVLEATGSRLIISTHPRLGQAGKPSLSGIAGGASYPRFSQTVFWLKNHDKPITSSIWQTSGTYPYQHKQSLEIRKARNGKGQGQHIAINLNFKSLCFDELGIIESENI